MTLAVQTQKKLNSCKMNPLAGYSILNLHCQTHCKTSPAHRTGWFGCQIQWPLGHAGHGVLHVDDGDRCRAGSGPGAAHPPGEPQTQGQSGPGQEERRSLQSGRFLRPDPKPVPREPGAGLFPAGTGRHHVSTHRLVRLLTSSSLADFLSLMSFPDPDGNHQSRGAH